MKSIFPLIFLSSFSSASAALVLTEIDLATGEIEVTNTATTAFSGTLLEWCRPFNYGMMESGGFSYAAGETRTYSTGLTGLTAADVWIYLDKSGGFGDVASVVSGVVFGSSQAGAGRVDRACPRSW